MTVTYSVHSGAPITVFKQHMQTSRIKRQVQASPPLSLNNRTSGKTQLNIWNYTIYL